MNSWMLLLLMLNCEESRKLNVLVINAQLISRNKVLGHLYYNEFIRNYHVWRFHGEDDNFIQVNNDMTSTHTIGEPEGTFRDLFIFVVDAHVRSSQFHHDISYQ